LVRDPAVVRFAVLSAEVAGGVVTAPTHAGLSGMVLRLTNGLLIAPGFCFAGVLDVCGVPAVLSYL
jgi:hypothetical protein